MLALIFCVQQLLADSCLPKERRIDWSVAGLLQLPQESIEHWIYVDDYSGSDYEKIIQAIKAADKQIGTTAIYFQSLLYQIDRPITITSNIKTTDDPIIFLGNRHPDSLTVLQFTGIDRDKHCLAIMGDWKGNSIPITADLSKGQDTLVVDPSHDNDFFPGDWVFLREPEFDDNYGEDSPYIGQMTRIKQLSDSSFIIKDKTAKSYHQDNDLTVQKILPVNNVGLENLKIERDNSEKGYGVTLYYNKTVNCWIKGVESYNCTGTHIKMKYSAHNWVHGCYVHKATNYDSHEGTGYGVILSSASNILIENNIFRQTRHAMLVGTGANSSVFGYNYSREAKWDDSYEKLGWEPGDIRLHGRYPYANLFESNSVAHIFGDPTHGDNGPYNTFLRNKIRADDLKLYNSDYSNTMANYIPDGRLTLSPSSLEQIAWPSARKSQDVLSVNDCTDLSFYVMETPDFFYSFSIFPAIETDHAAAPIPAEYRWNHRAEGRLIDYPLPDYPPIVINPLQDIIIPEDTASFMLNLAPVFDDPNMADTIIRKTVRHNSNKSLLSATVTNDSLSITVKQDQFGGSFLVIEAISREQSVFDTLQITVMPVNDAPVFTEILTDTTVQANTKFQFQYSSVDVEDDEIIYGLINNYKNLTIDTTGQLSWQIPDEVNGVFSIDVYVTDTMDTTFSEGTIKVEESVDIDRQMDFSEEFRLYQNSPNPFNPATTIPFDLPQPATVELTIFNITGNKVAQFTREYRAAGKYTITWSAENQSSGIYYYQLVTKEFVNMKPMMLIK